MLKHTYVGALRDIATCQLVWQSKMFNNRAQALRAAQQRNFRSELGKFKPLVLVIYSNVRQEGK